MSSLWKRWSPQRTASRVPRPHSRDSAHSLLQIYSCSSGLRSFLAWVQDAQIWRIKESSHFSSVSISKHLFLNSSSYNSGFLLSGENLSPIYLNVCNQFPSQVSTAGILISSQVLCTQQPPAGETEQLLLMVQFNSARFWFYNGLKLNLNSDTYTWVLSIIKSWQESGSSEWCLFAVLPPKIKPN